MEGFLGLGSLGAILKMVGIISRLVVKLTKDGFQFSDVGELVAELGQDPDFAEALVEVFGGLKKK
jgi:hypothetical protein